MGGRGKEGRCGVGFTRLIQRGETPFHVIFHVVLFHLQFPAACPLQWMGFKEPRQNHAHGRGSLLEGGGGTEAGSGVGQRRSPASFSPAAVSSSLSPMGAIRPSPALSATVAESVLTVKCSTLLNGKRGSEQAHRKALVEVSMVSTWRPSPQSLRPMSVRL